MQEFMGLILVSTFLIISFVIQVEACNLRKNLQS